MTDQPLRSRYTITIDLTHHLDPERDDIEAEPLGLFLMLRRAALGVTEERGFLVTITDMAITSVAHSRPDGSVLARGQMHEGGGNGL